MELTITDVDPLSGTLNARVAGFVDDLWDSVEGRLGLSALQALLRLSFLPPLLEQVVGGNDCCHASKDGGESLEDGHLVYKETELLCRCDDGSEYRVVPHDAPGRHSEPLLSRSLVLCLRCCAGARRPLLCMPIHIGGMVQQIDTPAF